MVILGSVAKAVLVLGAVLVWDGSCTNTQTLPLTKC